MHRLSTPIHRSADPGPHLSEHIVCICTYTPAADASAIVVCTLVLHYALPSTPLPCSVDPGLAAKLGSPLMASLGFFDGVTASMAPTVLAALREATGCSAYGNDEARFAYRCAVAVVKCRSAWHWILLQGEVVLEVC
jgi:hypothetical protein